MRISPFAARAGTRVSHEVVMRTVYPETTSSNPLRDEAGADVVKRAFSQDAVIGLRLAGEPHRVGQELHLVEVRDARAEDQLVGSDLPERVDPGPYIFGGSYCRLRDPLRPFGDERVVREQLADRLLLVIAEPEVREAHEAGCPGTPGLAVGRAEGLDHARSHFGRGAPDGEAAVPPDRATRGAGRVAPEQDGDPPSRRGRAERLGRALRRAPSPALVERLELLVIALSPGGEVLLGSLVVVRPGPDAKSEGQPTVGEPVDARRELGETGCAVRRSEQDVGQQLDPIGDGRGGGERRELVVCGPGHPADRGEAGEPPSLRTSGPCDERGPVHVEQRVADPDPDVHEGPPSMAISFSLSYPRESRNDRSGGPAGRTPQPARAGPQSRRGAARALPDRTGARLAQVRDAGPAPSPMWEGARARRAAGTPGGPDAHPGTPPVDPRRASSPGRPRVGAHTRVQSSLADDVNTPAFDPLA